jgi:hypothetical protein
MRPRPIEPRSHGWLVSVVVAHSGVAIRNPTGPGS